MYLLPVVTCSTLPPWAVGLFSSILCLSIFLFAPITLILSSTSNLLLCFCSLPLSSLFPLHPPYLHQVCCCTFNLALFSFLLPCFTHPSSVGVAPSTHRPAVISYRLQSKPKGREIKAFHCSQKPPRSKGGYISRLSFTHIDTHLLDKSHHTSIQKHCYSW